MRWSRLLALLLFLGVFGVALTLRAPSELVQRVLGSDTPPVLVLAMPRSVTDTEGIPGLEMVANEVRLAWRYERFSLSRLGPVYRVSLTGRGFSGEGRLAVTPFNRLLLMDVRLAILASDVGEDLWQAMFRPLGRVLVSIDHFEAALHTGRIDGLAGMVHWEDARSELAPEIDLGTVRAQLSAPEHNRIHAGITNDGGSIALSGTATLTVDESLAVDLYLEPRLGTSESRVHALALPATRENMGWRLRHTIPWS